MGEGAAEVHHSRRTVLRAGAWSAPVIAAAAAAPVFATSPLPKLTLRAIGPSQVPLELADGSMQTSWTLRVSSNSTQDIPAGSVVVSVPVPGVDHVVTGYGGARWAELASDGTTRRFVYNAPLVVGTEAGSFVTVRKEPINRPDTPTFTLTVTAAGLEPSSLDLTVPYSSVF